MKNLSLLTVSLLAALGSASPIAELEIVKRQGLLGGLVGSFVNAGYGKVPEVAGAAPKKTNVEARSKVAGSKSVKLRYGPYKVPNMKKKSVVGESGTLYNYPDLAVDKPCTECVLLGISAGLEYPDGKNANTDSGMWLHHMVMMNIGEGRMDPTCVGKMSLPHMVIGSDASKSERVFSSGNERSIVNFNPPWSNATNLGYFVKSTDKFGFIVDLMNQNMDDKTVYMTITYDYIDGRPTGFDNVKSIWLDAAQCGTSEVRPPKQTGAYTVSATWTANIEGEIMGAGGHLHDGGTHLTLTVDGKQVCDAVATYGSGGGGMGKDSGGGMSPGGMAAGGAGGMGGAAAPAGAAKGGAAPAAGAAKPNPLAKAEHITQMTGCPGVNMPIQQLKKGQKWVLQAFYDYDKHPGMKHDNGQQENVMGISIMYIKNPKI